MGDEDSIKFPSFPLTRYFLITGVLVAFVPMLLGDFIKRDKKNELSAEGEKLAVSMVDDLKQKIARRFKQKYRRSGRPVNLKGYEDRREFESWFAQQLANFDTAAVDYIRWDGSVGFSSREDQQAREWKEDPLLQSFMLQFGIFGMPSRYQHPFRRDPQFLAAMKGELNSSLKPRDSWNFSSYGRSSRRFGGSRGESDRGDRSRKGRSRKRGHDGRDRHGRHEPRRDSKYQDPMDFANPMLGGPWERAKYFMLKAYVPLEVQTADQAEKVQKLGVMIVHIELARLVKIIDSGSEEFRKYFIVGMLTLMLALYLWIRKAEKTIVDRTGALVDANKQLRRLSQDLEQQVEDRTRELVQSKNLASLGQLSAGIAHEVCNPVASIASCAEGLLKSLKQPEILKEAETLEEFDEYLQIIRDEAFRVKDITRSLLDFSRRGQAGGFATVNLQSVLEAMARLLTHRLNHEEKTLSIEFGDENVEIIGDDARLRQMVLNITLNAIDEISQGQCIRWSAECSETEVVLYCDDEGQGFKADEIDSALEPFHTGKPVGKGTGLGLSIADSVARQHGGRIELGNRKDTQGARVIVVLAREPNLDEDA
jgi:signal transduction histidine kinase